MSDAPVASPPREPTPAPVIVPETPAAPPPPEPNPAPVIVASSPPEVPAPVPAEVVTAPPVVAAPPPEAPAPLPAVVVPAPSTPVAEPVVSSSIPESVSSDPIQLQKISSIVSEPGLHDTTIDQRVEPTVTHEILKPTEIDAEQRAVVKDVEQEHYHTTVQNISDTQVLPEQRSYNVKAVAEQVFDHGDGKPLDLGPQFKDERIVKETRHDHTVLPTVLGEHIHHHIHERIQPVIQREIVQPSVVYTTVPVHEVHHDPIRYHATTALPTISLAEYQRQGGALGGHEPLHGDKHPGDPNAFGEPTSNIKDW